MFRMGEKISMMKKGQFGVVHGSVEKLFNPYHLMIETSNLEDLQEDALIKRVSTPGDAIFIFLHATAMSAKKETLGKKE